jgi:hypothetical protein
VRPPPPLGRDDAATRHCPWGRARQPRARPLMGARTHASPTGPGLGRGQLVPSHANCGEEIRGGHRFDPRAGRAAGESCLGGTTRLLALRSQRRALGFQTSPLRPPHAQPPARVVCHAPWERQLPLWKLGAEATSAAIGAFGRVLFARAELRQYGPPGNPEPVTGDSRQRASIAWLRRVTFL